MKGKNLWEKNKICIQTNNVGGKRFGGGENASSRPFNIKKRVERRRRLYPVVCLPKRI